MNKTLEYMVWYLAHENIGIYPMSVVGGDKPYEKRSEWQEGWNACALDHTRKVIKIEKWLEEMSDNIRTLVEKLILERKLDISIGDDKVEMYINCSDTFFWGCADGEDISIEELPELLECFKLSPNHGGDLWVCRKRKMRPQTACYKSRYPKEEWHLFDEAGEERTDSDGVGRKNL